MSGTMYSTGLLGTRTVVKTERSDQAQGIHGVQDLSDQLKVKNETQEDLRANS